MTTKFLKEKAVMYNFHGSLVKPRPFYRSRNVIRWLIGIQDDTIMIAMIRLFRA